MTELSTLTRIERVAVVGAGNMGSGIAQKIAAEGYPVVLVDVSEELVARGMQRLRQTLEEGVARRIFTRERADEIIGRISPGTTLDAARDCDLVIEAVFEELEVKRGVFSHLDRVCKPETILATNTSSLYVRDLARSTRRADRFLGLHYFYHPAKNRLVEVVAGEKTAPEIVDLAWRFQEIIGKTPIRSADSPGFIVNRYFVPWMNEAVRLLDEGVSDLAGIEAAAKAGFGVGMGPFELMNVTGITIGLHATSTLERELGPFYAPAAGLRAQFERGERWQLGDAGDAARPVDAKRQAQIIDRLLGVTFLIAGHLIDEGVCTIEDCDIGARVGLRWPAGPFELMNREGIDRAAKLAQEVAGRWVLPAPRILSEQQSRGVPFRPRRVRLEVQDGIATITINRPDALNSINEEVVDQLGETFADAIKRSDVRSIIITGAGKAFVAGADLKFFIEKMEKGDLAAVRTFTERGQALLSQIDRSPKTVVARLGGLALGGGAELALACDYIVASERGALGFPETGIGIYPGLGGTQRTRGRVGVALTKYLVFTGEVIGARAALEMGLVDAVADLDELEAAARAWAAKPPVDERRPGPLPERWRPLAELFGGTSVHRLLSAQPPGGDEARERVLRRVRSKAPLALRYAEEIIDAGAGLPLVDGLRLELEHLEDVFRSEDALIGMKSVGGGGRPEFKGR
jgi:enoyl-CoA hydratase/3-hydroxyacyl-CoA dehydrogenase